MMRKRNARRLSPLTRSSKSLLLRSGSLSFSSYTCFLIFSPSRSRRRASLYMRVRLDYFGAGEGNHAPCLSTCALLRGIVSQSRIHIIVIQGYALLLWPCLRPCRRRREIH